MKEKNSLWWGLPYKTYMKPSYKLYTAEGWPAFTYEREFSNKLVYPWVEGTLPLVGYPAVAGEPIWVLIAEWSSGQLRREPNWDQVIDVSATNSEEISKEHQLS